ncbi:MAG: Nif3-like dinuclear metal center hexameric protein [Methanospirillum sp.]|nr:Nif3-like dinuclear metal center hexameric protein [Methanospirillum sp.]
MNRVPVRGNSQPRAEIIAVLEDLASPDLAEPFDAGRIGLIIEGKDEISVVHTCLDVTPAVVRAAVSQGSDMLVAHHTPIWNPLTRIRGDNASLFRSVLNSGLNVYVMHTNWDHAPGGVNDILASELELAETEPMSLGVTGDCPLSLREIEGRLKAPLRIWGDVESPCRLAVAGGSAFDPALMEEAAHLGADAFLSAELRHSVYRSSPLPLLESTHYALESPAMRVLAGRFGWTFLDDPPLLHTLHE